MEGESIETSALEPDKSAYASPRLVRLGDMVELTQAISVGAPDGITGGIIGSEI